MKRINILLYGDQNLNIMDGSAIWLTSLTNILTDQNTVHVTVLLKTPVTRNQVIDNITNRDQVTFINPFVDLEINNKKQKAKRLEPKEASLLIERLDRTHNYDFVITRGKDLTAYCLKRKFVHKLIPYITDFTFKKNPSDKTFFSRAYRRTKALFVQTEAMRDYLKEQLQLNGEKFILLPPTVANVEREPKFSISNYSIVYTGKFAKLWETEALLDSYMEVKKVLPEVSLHIAGDKFQRDLALKKSQLINQFNTTPGIRWVGAVSREESMQLVQQSDVGFAYRSEEIDNDNSLELSTKFLEYGINGKPVIVRKTKQYVQLLGEDYPLYCYNEEELVEKLIRVFTQEEVYQKAAKRCYEASKYYQLSLVSKQILQQLDGMIDRKVTILFAGHDFKFLRWYMDHCEKSGRYRVLIDKWYNHSSHNERNSLQLLKQADIIFCEWGLGNAVFYSNNKLPGQRLYIRIHRQELMTAHLSRVNYKNVTKVIAISTHIYEEFHRIKKIPRSKMVIIPNMVDVDKFKLPKQKNITYHLGLLGYVPKLKRLDRAIDILDKLYEHDKRFTLYIKGKHPKELLWLWRQKEQREYFKQLFKKIRRAKWRKNVVFDKHGDDVAEWFTNINFVLSTSDIESFHLAPMEGMASGTIPIVFSWPGADTLYPKKNIVDTVDEAVELILKEVQKRTNPKEYYQNRVKKFDKNILIERLDSLLFSSC